MSGLRCFCRPASDDDKKCSCLTCSAPASRIKGELDQVGTTTRDFADYASFCFRRQSIQLAQLLKDHRSQAYWPASRSATYEWALPEMAALGRGGGGLLAQPARIVARRDDHRYAVVNLGDRLGGEPAPTIHSLPVISRHSGRRYPVDLLDFGLRFIELRQQTRDVLRYFPRQRVSLTAGHPLIIPALRCRPAAPQPRTHACEGGISRRTR
jgi:hypothetical protein